MKIKTQIAKLTRKMNLGEISIGECLLCCARLSEEHNAGFSKEFLAACKKEGYRLSDTYDTTLQDIAIKRLLQEPFGSLLDNPPRADGEKNEN